MFRSVSLVLAGLVPVANAGHCSLMANHHNTEFTVKVEVGTPGQSMNLVADAGSSDLVVASTICENCGGHHNLYNFKKSKTGTDTGKSGMISYGQGSVLCALVEDTVKVAGASAHHVPVAVMAVNGLAGFAHAPYDGVMGLGPSATSRDGSGKTLLAKMGEDVFSICFGTSDGSAGRLELGSGIGSGYGHAIPAHGSSHWTLPMEGVGVGGHMESHSGKAIVDSGTSLIGVPGSVHQMLQNKIGHVAPDCGNKGSLPDVKFKLGGQVFTLTPQHYVVRIKGESDDLSDWENATSTMKKSLAGSPFNLDDLMDVDLHSKKRHKMGGACKSAFFANGGEVILGIPFMRAYAVKFDRGKHNVAFSKVHSGGMCSSCGGEAADTSLASLEPPNAAGAEEEETPLLPLNKIRLPWFLLNPNTTHA